MSEKLVCLMKQTLPTCIFPGEDRIVLEPLVMCISKGPRQPVDYKDYELVKMRVVQSR